MFIVLCPSSLRHLVIDYVNDDKETLTRLLNITKGNLSRGWFSIHPLKVAYGVTLWIYGHFEPTLSSNDHTNCACLGHT